MRRPHDPTRGFPSRTRGEAAGRERSRSPRRSGITTVASLLILLTAMPLLSGCLTRSTTVGDRYAGTIIVATSPDNPSGAPRLDIPESMKNNVSTSDYREEPQGNESASPSPGASAPASPSATTQPGTTGQGATRVGTRATFSDLTSGQLSQLGDIVANAFGDTSMTMELNAKRNGDVVRFRGSADLNGLEERDYLKFTLAFAGPITASNVQQQDSETSVTWTPQPGKVTEFIADATYPDPATAAFKGWTWLLVIVCLLVVALIIWLAYTHRDTSPRPGRPRSTRPTAPKSSTTTGPAGRKTGANTTAAKTQATATAGTSAASPSDASASAASSSVASDDAPRPGPTAVSTAPGDGEPGTTEPGETHER